MHRTHSRRHYFIRWIGFFFLRYVSNDQIDPIADRFAKIINSKIDLYSLICTIFFYSCRLYVKAFHTQMYNKYAISRMVRKGKVRCKCADTKWRIAEISDAIVQRSAIFWFYSEKKDIILLFLADIDKISEHQFKKKWTRSEKHNAEAKIDFKHNGYEYILAQAKNYVRSSTLEKSGVTNCYGFTVDRHNLKKALARG